METGTVSKRQQLNQTVKKKKKKKKIIIITMMMVSIDWRFVYIFYQYILSN